MSNIKKSAITCYDRLADRKPEGYSQWLNPIFDIERGVEVGLVLARLTIPQACLTQATAIWD